MKPGMRWLIILALAGTAASGPLLCPLLCPLGMGSPGQSDMPCSNPSNPPSQCAFSICQASSSYLASHANADTPVLQSLPVEVVDLATIWISPAGAKLIRWDDKAPPGSDGPLFLRTHALLI